MKKIYGLILVFCAFTTRSAEAEWLTDLPAALAKAKAENKKVLVNFTGSDWCGWCIRLKNEVFDQPKFVAYAREKLVLVELDFPKKKQQTKQLRAANEGLAKQFGVKGFPTIYLLDPDGNKLLRNGYQPGGPSNYIALLERHNKPAPASSAQHPPAPTVTARPSVSPTQPPPAIRYAELNLKGITGTKNRRLALINDQILGVGEKAKVKLGDGQVEVVCQEIRDTSVLIKVANEAESRELKFKN